jgi:hypothetical protein
MDALQTPRSVIEQELLENGYFVIATNGASELLCISQEPDCPVYAFDSNDAQRIRRRLKVSATFDTFLEMLGIEPSE